MPLENKFKCGQGNSLQGVGTECGGNQRESGMLLIYLWIGSEARRDLAQKELSENPGNQRMESELSAERRR